MTKRLENKTAIITGATSGIGEASAILFAREGASVVLVGRRDELGKRVVGRIRKEGGEAIYIKADVSKSGQVERLVAVPKRAIYAASKGAVMMLTKAMAMDYAPYHIINNLHSYVALSLWNGNARSGRQLYGRH